MEDGKVGYSWKVPNSMGKIRYDQDKSTVSLIQREILVKLSILLFTPIHTSLQPKSNFKR